VARVDFYILRASGEVARQQFACRLAEKAYKLDNRVHIHVDGPESARRIDDLLWTFRDGSFVPHELLGTAETEPASPVTIACDRFPPGDCDLLINLGDSIPDAAGTFPRVAEVVTSDEECKSLSRQRFVDYRDQGHTLDTHNL
jgi:DNA polymerase-3 subunit chi